MAFSVEYESQACNQASSYSVKCPKKHQLVFSTCLVIILVGGRGFSLAWMIDGTYPLSAFLLDALALGLVLLALRVFDGVLRWCLEKLVRPDVKWRQMIMQVSRLAIVIMILVPFLIMTLSIHPQRVRCRLTPSRFGLVYEDVFVESDGLRLHAWYIPGRNETGPVVLVAHGLGANKQNFLVHALDLNTIGYPVMIFDFRAHGDSEGYTTSFGIREAEDVKAAHDWLVNRHPQRPVCALGYSMGGAAVARAVQKYQIFDKIILDSTFSSAHRVAHVHYLRFFGPLEPLAWAQGRFWCWLWTGADLAENSPASYAGSLMNKSVMLIHGKADSIIPYTESIRLHEALEGRPELWIVHEANHMEAYMDASYFSRVQSFLESE